MMKGRRWLTLLLFVGLAYSLNSCYFFVRELDVPATIVITPEFTPEDHTLVAAPQYIHNFDLETYKNDYMEELRTTIGTYNITLADFGTEADYELVITKMVITESEKTETVDDEDSEYNGYSYALSECEVYVQMELYEGTGRTNKVKSNTITTDKEEKLSNNRSLGDLISGGNKDNNTYREKMLSDDVFRDMAQKNGRNTAAWMSSKIKKSRKK